MKAIAWDCGEEGAAGGGGEGGVCDTVHLRYTRRRARWTGVASRAAYRCGQPIEMRTGFEGKEIKGLSLVPSQISPSDF